MTDARSTFFTCTSYWCKCARDGADEIDGCACLPGYAGLGKTECRECGSAMRAFYCDTGEPVETQQ